MGKYKFFLFFAFLLEFLFFVFLLEGCAGKKKVLVFGFFKREGDEYFYRRDSYSYGVINSSYNLLRFLGDYEFLGVRDVNFVYGDYGGMVSNNRGYDFYLTGEYSLVEGEVSYIARLHDRGGNVVWDCVIVSNTEVDSLFGVADEIALRSSKFLMNKEMELGSVGIEVLGDLNRVMDIEVNDYDVYKG
ncbi:MAG: hypothetical protein ACK4F9_05265, partial [Brevinematia bacterium]